MEVAMEVGIKIQPFKKIRRLIKVYFKKKFRSQRHKVKVKYNALQFELNMSTGDTGFILNLSAMTPALDIFMLISNEH